MSQYFDRLHREYNGKADVKVYDYICTQKRSDNIYQKRLLHLLSAHSISASVKNKLTHSFVVIDSRTVRYSSRELFSASDDNCVLRLEDKVLAWELMDSIK